LASVDISAGVPTVNSIDPVFVNSTTGVNITISGDGFSNGGELQCVIGNVTVPALVLNDSSLICLVPPGEVVSGNVTITSPSDGWSSDPVIVPVINNTAPAFIAPSPYNGEVFCTTTGQKLSILLSAYDTVPPNTTAPVTISFGALPSGATVENYVGMKLQVNIIVYVSLGNRILWNYVYVILLGGYNFKYSTLHLALNYFVVIVTSILFHVLIMSQGSTPPI